MGLTYTCRNCGPKDVNDFYICNKSFCKDCLNKRDREKRAAKSIERMKEGKGNTVFALVPESLRPEDYDPELKQWVESTKKGE